MPQLAILDELPDAVVICDARGSLRYVNRTTHAVFGYEEGSLVGQPLDTLVPSRFRVAHASHRDGYFAAPRVRPMALGLTLMGLKKDGTELPLDISLAPLRYAEETCALAAIRDASDRKRMEERERQILKAEEEIRRRDEVLAIASHELRAPVGCLQLQVSVLHRTAASAAVDLNAMRDRLAATAAELTAMQERMAKVERHARRLARLVEELLDVSNPHLAELPMKREETDLADLTREVAGNLRLDVERTGSSLTVDADGPVLGLWDPVRMEQVIANLLLNASKFGAGAPITVTVRGDERVARVVVSDHGVGIALADQERIFGRFERAVAAGGVLGLGLGLYIARQLVRAHGGELQLKSELGVGSTFTVALPRTPALSVA